MSTVDFSEVLWRKSVRSGDGNNGNCVEVAFAAGAVGVRDSKHSVGGRLAFGRDAWDAFALVCRREAR